MAECAECESLEKQFIAVRSERTELLLDGKITGVIMGRLAALDKKEMAVLSAILDHKILHRLQKH
jgi:hypothetical protein